MGGANPQTVSGRFETEQSRYKWGRSHFNWKIHPTSFHPTELLEAGPVSTRIFLYDGDLKT